METQFKETLNKTEEQKIKKKEKRKERGGGEMVFFYYICTYCTDKLVYVEQ